MSAPPTSSTTTPDAGARREPDPTKAQVLPALCGLGGPIGDRAPVESASLAADAHRLSGGRAQPHLGLRRGSSGASQVVINPCVQLPLISAEPVTGPSPELVASLALQRAHSGAVAKLDEDYLNRGLPTTGHLAGAFDELTAARLLALADPDPHGLRRVTLTTTMRRIPPGTHPGTAAQAEETLAHAARRFDPAALARIAERLLAHLDPDGNTPAEEPEQQRELRVRTGPDGIVSLNGKLDPEGGARVLEVLNSLNGRRSPVDGVPDTRTPARRNADALVEAMSCLLDEGELPTRGGQRPHLVLTMKLPDLIDGLGTATLDTGGCLTAAEARRLACDATLIPMVLGSDSMPLDVGRQHRLATAALRDALAQRDQGCSFPGCDRPPRYCHAHHLVSWLDGGETKLSNMCMLCEHHHVIVHRQGWHIRLDARGRPEFIPPKTIDPTRRPLHDPLRQ